VIANASGTGGTELVFEADHTQHDGASLMQFSLRRRVVSAVFDEPNLVSAAALVPAGRAGHPTPACGRLADQLLTVPTDEEASV